MSDPTRDVLDTAIRDYAVSMLRDGEVIIGWLALAATRAHDGGGVVITLISDEAIPRWQARGILAEAIATVGTDDEDD